MSRMADRDVPAPRPVTFEEAARLLFSGEYDDLTAGEFGRRFPLVADPGVPAPEETPRPEHRCQPPIFPGYLPRQPDWECHSCGKVWRDQISGSMRWWAAVRL